MYLSFNHVSIMVAIVVHKSDRHITCDKKNYAFNITKKTPLGRKMVKLFTMLNICMLIYLSGPEA